MHFIFIFMRYPKNYWTKDKCLLEARKFSSKTELQKANGSLYNSMWRNGWTNECCLHMKKVSSILKRAIYLVEFSDKTVYVGLSCNPTKRFKKHLVDKKSTVFKYSASSGIIPELKILTDFIDYKIIGLIEQQFIDDYKSKGYLVINKLKAGGLGGKIITWTKEKCFIEAKKYDNRTCFQKNSSAAYQSAYKNGWLNEICAHMISNKVEDGFWSHDNIMLLAERCESLKSFRKEHKYVYQKLLRNLELKNFIHKKLNWHN